MSDFCKSFIEGHYCFVYCFAIFNSNVFPCRHESIMRLYNPRVHNASSFTCRAGRIVYRFHKRVKILHIVSQRSCGSHRDSTKQICEYRKFLLWVKVRVLLFVLVHCLPHISENFYDRSRLFTQHTTLIDYNITLYICLKLLIELVKIVLPRFGKFNHH